MLQRNSRGWTFAAAASTIVVLLPGCGGGHSSPSTSAADPATQAAESASTGAGTESGACSMITGADARAALGQPAGNGKTNQGGCEFTVSGKNFSMLRVKIFPQIAEANFRQLANGSGGVTVSPVAGLGDEAFIDTTNTFLSVRQGSNAVAVTLIRPGLSKTQVKTAAITVARRILARL